MASGLFGQTTIINLTELQFSYSVQAAVGDPTVLLEGTKDSSVSQLMAIVLAQESGTALSTNQEIIVQFAVPSTTQSNLGTGIMAAFTSIDNPTDQVNLLTGWVLSNNTWKPLQGQIANGNAFSVSAIYVTNTSNWIFTILPA